MRRVSRQFYSGFLMLALIVALPANAQTTTKLILPANSYMEMVVTRPVWAATAKAGDPLYLETSSPVTVGDIVAIPAGSYVLAQLEKITRPTSKNNQAVLLVDFQKIIFANGYTVVLDKKGAQTTSVVTVSVTTANDLLLDNATKIFTNLGSPVTLRQKQVQSAVVIAKPPDFSSLQSATKCVPDPGTPGDPGSDGTPDITIPGNPGTPDMTGVNPDGTTYDIPGIPATPDTVIPGTPATPATPGTPPTYCPDPPQVTSSVLVSLADTAAPATGSAK